MWDCQPVASMDVPLSTLSFSERFSLIILLLFVLDSLDYTGTCLVFTAPHISPSRYFGPDQFSLSNKVGTAQMCPCCRMGDVWVSLPSWVCRVSPLQLLQAELLLLSVFVALGCAAGKTQA